MNDDDRQQVAAVVLISIAFAMLIVAMLAWHSEGWILR